MTDNAEDLRLALRLCDVADGLSMSLFRRSGLNVRLKSDSTPVTDADRLVERALVSEIARVHPDDAAVGEEYGLASDRESDRRWIVDPIDGTQSFIAGVPIWATLVALEVGGEVVVGAASAPALGRRWWAARGMGAYGNAGTASATSLRVSTVSRLGDARLSGSGISDWAKRGGPFPIIELARRCAFDRSLGDFWPHVLVAEGAYDIAVDPATELWDVAALQVIVEEAGGTLTDLCGTRRADGGNAVSSNCLLHAAAIGVLSGSTTRPPSADSA